ncbi:amidohydrolase family protein [Candidatus Neomarinimicrobiota bacterium]
MSVRSLLLYIVAANALFAEQQTTAIVGGTLINTDGSGLLENSVILLNGEIIDQVGTVETVSVPGGSQVIDASGKYIIPGLIDAHVHFFQSGGLYTRPDAIDLRKHVPYVDGELAEIKERLPDTFRRYIRSGITSVVDVGGPLWNFDVRTAAQKDSMAPTVAVAGPLISTYQPDALTTDDPPIIKVNSIREAKKLVRQQAQFAPDLIKIWYIANHPERGTPPAEETYPIIEATTRESHKLGYRVAVHATELETARLAIKAGADVLVHGVKDKIVDQAFIDMLIDNEVIYTPTIAVVPGYAETYSQMGKFLPEEFEIANPYTMGTLFDLRHLPKEDIPERRRIALQNAEPVVANSTALENLRILSEAGALIAVGTDAGNIGTLPGPAIFEEFRLMAKAGISPENILRSATQVSAKVMGQEAKRGTVEPGKMADLVILNSNPLDNISNTGDIQGVVKAGRYFAVDEIIPFSPVDLVQQQLNAYNAGDIKAFVSTYSTNIEIFTHPDSLIMEGHDAIFSRYGPYFDENPRLHVEILDRMTFGDYVIDQEHVTGRANGLEKKATAIYQIEGKLIRRVWFLDN